MSPLRFIFASFVLASAVHGATARINFTPQRETTREDGTSIQRVYFQSPNGKISVRVPRDWEVVGTNGALRITSRNFRDAEARLSNGGEFPAEFDEAGLIRYRELAERLLPRQAESIEPLEEKTNAVEINDWQGFEKSFSYRVAGRKFVRRILFVKLDPEREVRLVVDALESDAEKFYGQCRGMLNSWVESE